MVQEASTPEYLQFPAIEAYWRIAEENSQRITLQHGKYRADTPHNQITIQDQLQVCGLIVHTMVSLQSDCYCEHFLQDQPWGW